MSDMQLQSLDEYPESRIIEAARDIVRAWKRGLSLGPFLDLLEQAVSGLADDEFYCWCEEVTAIAATRLGTSVEVDWNFSAHFNQGLTRLEGADRLCQFLKED